MAYDSVFKSQRFEAGVLGPRKTIFSISGQNARVCPSLFLLLPHCLCCFYPFVRFCLCLRLFVLLFVCSVDLCLHGTLCQSVSDGVHVLRTDRSASVDHLGVRVNRFHVSTLGRPLLRRGSHDCRQRNAALVVQETRIPGRVATCRHKQQLYFHVGHRCAAGVQDRADRCNLWAEVQKTIVTRPPGFPHTVKETERPLFTVGESSQKKKCSPRDVSSFFFFF